MDESFLRLNLYVPQHDDELLRYATCLTFYGGAKQVDVVHAFPIWWAREDSWIVRYHGRRVARDGTVFIEKSCPKYDDDPSLSTFTRAEAVAMAIRVAEALTAFTGQDPSRSNLIPYWDKIPYHPSK